MSDRFRPFHGSRYRLDQAESSGTQQSPAAPSNTPLRSSAGDSSSRYDERTQPPAGQPEEAEQELTASQVLGGDSPVDSPVILVEDPVDPPVIDAARSHHANIWDCENMRDVAASWMYTLPNHRFVEDLRSIIEDFLTTVVLVLSQLEAGRHIHPSTISCVEQAFANLRGNVAGVVPEVKRTRIPPDTPTPIPAATIASDSDSASDIS